ncbi:lysophospholipid transporter LplT [Leptothrix discophora]|uniref:Lysophospholipid transporter LplT n=1 Tax=Leptothrix discophora TaxID=89 RepID=A0ABT9G6K0_LEPDI|nr:lysophospholipid transporter LplT [Leptothrix discophora]MDP4302105.1 lysophospholipid transporter LplT [Leptothrix discophora]
MHRHAGSAAGAGLPRGFHRLIAAQFCSALADNALLIVTIALLVEQGAPGWWAPMLKFGFTLSYVLLAPVVGPLADAWPKARLMAWMNLVKVLGVVGLLLGWPVLLAFSIVGFGAAAYAPAKYGLVTEMVGADRLVEANGWIEVSVVGAALLGAVVGGVLVGPWWTGSTASLAWREAVAWLTGQPAEGVLGLSLLAVLAVHALASWLTVGVPDSGARYPACEIHPRALLRAFREANRLLWRDPDGGLSLAVTTIFWGLGATLQFIVLRWAADVLHLPLDRAAFLQAAVAIGVVVGATAAGRWVALHQAKHMLWAGVALGLTMPVVAVTSSLPLALALLVIVGAVGGLMVVPLNALLQHRGCELLSAGRSIAVQGFNENASVLAMLAIYAGLLALDVGIVPLMWGFGLAIALAIAGLIVLEHRRARRARLAGALAPQPSTPAGATG